MGFSLGLVLFRSRDFINHKADIRLTVLCLFVDNLRRFYDSGRFGFGPSLRPPIPFSHFVRLMFCRLNECMNVPLHEPVNANLAGR